MSTTATEPTVAQAAKAERAIRTPWSEFWRKFRKQHVALGAGIFVLLLIAVAIIAEIIRERRTGVRDSLTLGTKSGRLRASA